MKVLWFEISVPGRYKDEGVPTGGWQDSLYNPQNEMFSHFGTKR